MSEKSTDIKGHFITRASPLVRPTAGIELLHHSPSHRLSAVYDVISTSGGCKKTKHYTVNTNYTSLEVLTHMLKSSVPDHTQTKL